MLVFHNTQPVFSSNQEQVNVVMTVVSHGAAVLAQALLDSMQDVVLRAERLRPALHHLVRRSQTYIIISLAILQRLSLNYFMFLIRSLGATEYVSRNMM